MAVDGAGDTTAHGIGASRTLITDRGAAVEQVVVIGQGYVGLPLAHAAALAGHRVRGLDSNTAVVNDLNAGESHVDGLTSFDVRDMLERGYEAAADPSVISDASVVVVCVPTPLAEDRTPDLSAIAASADAIAANLPGGTQTLVVLESTTYPGTTQDFLQPLLEVAGLRHGPDFLLAFSPERVDPGNAVWRITNTPKIVAGVSPAATRRAVAFYRTFIDTVVEVNGPREAETAKLLENTYRHVNIALVNEIARFCHELEIDVWEVIRAAATKPFGFHAFTPGPGVGGHCIPIDPNYLGYQVRKLLGYQFRFVELAQEINQSMPRYVVERVADALNDVGKPLRGSRVLLLGVTYKPDVADQRESPAVPVAALLLQKGAQVAFADPHVPLWEVAGRRISAEPDAVAAAADADIVVLLQRHSSLDLGAICEKAALLFDTRGETPPASTVIRL